MEQSLFTADGVPPTRLAILSCIARSRFPLGATDIRKRMDLLGWRREKDSHLPLLQKLLMDGLVAGTEGDVRLYTLTPLGWQKLKEWLETADAVVSLFGDLLHAPAPRLAAPTHAHKEVMKQRLPTPEEMEKIIAHCTPVVGRLLRAFQITGINPSHLAELRIDAIDWDKKVGNLPAKTRENRPIKNRTVEITPELEAVILSAIGSRTTGWVFRPPNSPRWLRDRLSRAFRAARNEAGIPEEVLIMGRGGGLNAADSSEDDESDED